MEGQKHYHGHRQRLRERFQEAPETLPDYEILELLLGYVLTRRDTKPMAKELLSRFKTLRGVIEAEPEEYDDIPGIGQGVVNFFSLMQELTPRYIESKVRSKEKLCDAKTVALMARERLGRRRNEEVWTAFVDTSNRLLVWEKISQGSLGSTSFNPRLLIERALRHSAAGFIIVHNHPGGNPTPSGVDLEVTKRTEQAANAVFLKFIDHVIVTDSACFSIMSDGLLSV